MNRRRILITGASGFVGRHLLGRLAGGSHELVAIHKSPLPPAVREASASSLTWHECDIATGDLSPVMQGVSTVFHLAAHSSISETDSERALMERVNVLGTHRVAAAARAAGVGHFIFVSSVAACEAADVADITETNGEPRSTYGKTKKAAEDELLSLASDSFRITVLRPTALFGEHHKGSVFELTRAIHRRRFVIIGNGRNRTNFYYVADFTDALIAVDHNPETFGQVFIAGDRAFSQRELVKGVAAALGVRGAVPSIPRAAGLAAGFCLDGMAALTHRHMPLSARRVRAMTRDVAYSSEKLRLVAGVTSGIGVMAGLRRTIAWYRQQGWL